MPVIRTFRLTVDIEVSDDQDFDSVSQLCVGFLSDDTDSIDKKGPHSEEVLEYLKVEELQPQFETLFSVTRRKRSMSSLYVTGL